VELNEGKYNYQFALLSIDEERFKVLKAFAQFSEKSDLE
jgi:hypothetical protein